MKKAKIIKFISIFSLINILFLTLASCFNHESNEYYNGISTNYDSVIDEKDLDHIYEIAPVSSSFFELNFNRTRVIPKSEEREAPSKILDKISINNIEHKLTYVKSEYSLYANIIYDEYYMDGDQDTYLRLYNGQILSMNPYTKVDISPNATPEEALEILKKKLSKVIDISKYANVDMPSQKDTDRFRSYDFLFYNSIDGYITDVFTAFIYDDGKINIGLIENLAVKVSNLNIDKELENKAIELKLKSVYGNAYHSYEIYKISDDVNSRQRKVIFYNNELYIHYAISANFMYEGEIMSNYVEYYLIPVGMISKK